MRNMFEKLRKIDEILVLMLTLTLYVGLCALCIHVFIDYAILVSKRSKTLVQRDLQFQASYIFARSLGEISQS